MIFIKKTYLQLQISCPTGYSYSPVFFSKKITTKFKNLISFMWTQHIFLLGINSEIITKNIVKDEVRLLSILPTIHCVAYL